MKQYDVVIVGSGLSGLTTALNLDPGLRVAVLSKEALQSGASDWAQGGIAAVLSDEDSIESHIEDTLIAGAGLCDPDAVRHVVSNGPEALTWLREQQVPFTRDPNSPERLHLTREGGHAVRRIAHVADSTGNAIMSALVEQVHAARHIDVYEHYMAVDVIVGGSNGARRCQGVHVLNCQSDVVETFAACHVVLATGGAGKVYLFTTAPDGSSGDGIAMAHRAGCRTGNMEFMQFHPTCLFHPEAKSFLISEAVRGEGGILRLPNGHRFMPEHDDRAELAPRDVVARAIDFEMKRHGVDCVYLDITHKDADELRGHFPLIHQRCLELGIDITRDPIPVVPAAHYTCGGVVVDEHGRTDVPGLYCLGEAAFTGLHGANRLASNSLLECVVYGRSAARFINREDSVEKPFISDWDDSQVRDPDEAVVIANNWAELRRCMWNYMGIVRTDKRLGRALNRIRMLQEEIQEYYAAFRINSDLLEMRNLLVCAELMVRCALTRRESRGIHYSLDTPNTSPKALPTIISPIDKR